MKRQSTTVSVLFLLGTLSLAPALLAHDDGPCSYSSVSGDWGFTSSGTRVGVGPVAGVGTATLEKSGNVDGAQTVSFNGIIANETFTGTYTVNSDCTGSLTVVVSSPIAPRTSHLNLMFVSNSRAVRAIFTDDGTTLTMDGKKLD